MSSPLANADAPVVRKRNWTTLRRKLRDRDFVSGSVYVTFFGLMFLMSSWEVGKILLDDYRYQLSDWGINYAGGFVRRGFAGEVLLSVSDLSGVPFNQVVLGLTVVLNAVFYGLAATLLWPYRHNRWAWIALYAPAGIVAPALHPDMLGHKDILLFALTAVLFWAGGHVENPARRTAVVLAGLAMTIPLLLSHEGYVIFLPILATSAFMIPRSRATLTALAVIATGALLATLLSVKFAGTLDQRDMIIAAYMEQLPLQVALRALDDQFAFLYISQSLEEALKYVTPRNAAGLPELHLILLLVFAPLLWAGRKLGCFSILRRRHGLWPSLMIAASFAGFVLLIPVIVDWTRFLHVFGVVTLLAVAALCVRERSDWREPEPKGGFYVSDVVLGWCIFAALFFFTPGKVTPDLVQFQHRDILFFLLLCGALVITYRSGRKA